VNQSNFCFQNLHQPAEKMLRSATIRGDVAVVQDIISATNVDINAAAKVR
jgi:hypothetical protein